MRHIKTFEKYDPDKLRLFLDELEEFCQESLVFLTDLGPRLSIDSSYGRNILPRKIDDEIEAKVSLVFMDLNRRWTFDWIDIKDYIIPFMMRLDKSYKIKSIEINGKESIFNQERNRYYGVDFTINADNADRVIKDKLDDNLLIMTMKIEVETNIGEKPFSKKVADFGDKINQILSCPLTSATKAANKLNKFLNDKI